MAEFEARNPALPGDVVVIDGVAGISNMGGISAQTGKRHGEARAIVPGGIRDGRAFLARRLSAPGPRRSRRPPGSGASRSWKSMAISRPPGCGSLPAISWSRTETGVCFILIARAAEIPAKALDKAAFEGAKWAVIDAGNPPWADSSGECVTPRNAQRASSASRSWATIRARFVRSTALLLAVGPRRHDLA